MPNPYKYDQFGNVLHVASGVVIGQDPHNAQWNQYQAAGGDAVTDPADPPPLVYNAFKPIDARVRTTDATPTEVYRATLSVNTGYSSTLTLTGVDAGNGAVRVIRASVVAKRLSANAILVGAPVVLANHADAGTTTWGIDASVNGHDFVVTVTGAAGRTIDWSLVGDISGFTPSGA